MKAYKEILAKYLPEQTVDLVYNWIKEYRIGFRITRDRHSKQGDFRSRTSRKPHRITVNHNLNKYAFLLTFVHELAHLIVWEKYRNRARPHGTEWKHTFRELMLPLLGKGVFPDDVEKVIARYLINAKASSGADKNLASILRKYDNQQQTLLEDLPINAMFRIYNGKTFKKIEKLRTRYRCLCLENKKMYYVHGMAPVAPIEPETV
ncbi:MAG: SprT-like domain-containing protein [Bacteroidales bacterium]|nr:SprT-like domain-containing protein [Bacteroidales bacterium]MCF8343167.1 SprT-like domain-containing protein [Bacteroidales bacterium]MCF8350660.1 SprT-like domain-containing protein [Bacteroidales bacterium]MCF8376826.1 SprT-like domain-containing protein [Bacteroidales bacterium]MCF8400733.1 SprT-like domain-containing protein [Bacteroidales bacterium]